MGFQIRKKFLTLAGVIQFTIRTHHFFLDAAGNSIGFGNIKLMYLFLLVSNKTRMIVKSTIGY